MESAGRVTSAACASRPKIAAAVTVTSAAGASMAARSLTNACLTGPGGAVSVMRAMRARAVPSFAGVRRWQRSPRSGATARAKAASSLRAYGSVRLVSAPWTISLIPWRARSSPAMRVA